MGANEINLLEIITTFFFLGVWAAYLKGPRMALVLNPALHQTLFLKNNDIPTLQ